MKKKIALFLIFCIVIPVSLLFFVRSCEMAVIDEPIDFGTGYFITVQEFRDSANSPLERIVYASDTKVMYYMYTSRFGSGMTPLYNADGTLQIYEGE